LGALNAARDVVAEVIRPACFGGEQAYALPSGWVVEVFFDAGAWGYIDSVTAPDGRRWAFEGLTDAVRRWDGGRHIWPPCELGP
jgi:hypothetical protein